MIEIKVGDIIKVNGQEYKVLNVDTKRRFPIYAMSIVGETQNFACWEISSWRRVNN